MLILGVDTATPVASVGLLHDGRVLAEASETTVSHAERLLPLIQGILRQSRVDLAQIDGIGLTIGPGAFSGLRMALATAKGLAYALSVRLAGVSTLLALAHAVTDWTGHVCVLLDARKREVYAAFFDLRADGKIIRLSQDVVLTPDRLLEQTPTPCVFVGDGAERYAEVLRDRYGPAARLVPLATLRPRAGIVACLAWRRFQRGDFDDATQLVPRYIRRSDAERNKARQSVSRTETEQSG